MDDIQTARLRPGMYVGDTVDGTGLHNMLYAALDNSLSEVRCGNASHVSIDLSPDGSCTVADDRLGMPIAAPEGDGRSVPEMLLTQDYFGIIHAVRTNRVETIPNTGLVPVNALSSWVELRTVSDGIEYLIRFDDGKLVRPLAAVAASERRLVTQGATISFRPNPDVFARSVFDAETIGRTLRNILWTTGVSVTLTGHRKSGEAG